MLCLNGLEDDTDHRTSLLLAPGHCPLLLQDLCLVGCQLLLHLLHALAKILLSLPGGEAVSLLQVFLQEAGHPVHL